MKGLTLTQPWASLVALGEKRIETRGWETGYRGPIAIHAGKGAGPVGGEDGLRELMAREPYASALARNHLLTAEQLPRGAVVATARLVACVSTNRLKAAMQELPSIRDFKVAEHERAFGDYRACCFAWFLADIEAFAQPVEWKGAQGLWPVGEDVWWVPAL